MKSKKLLILGAGQLGLLVSKIIKTKKFQVIGFIDNDKKRKEKINGIKVLGNDSKLKNFQKNRSRYCYW